MLVDTHCHLDRYLHAGTLDAVLERAQKASVAQLIAVGTCPKDWELYEAVVSEYSGRVYRTLGLHPCYVQRDYQEALDWQHRLLRRSRKGLVALGEIGLDYFHLPEDEMAKHGAQKYQADAFRYQLEWAQNESDLPIIIHSRDAFQDTLSILKEMGIPGERVVMHCFSAGAQEVSQLNDYGARASFTGIVGYKNADAVREALSAQGLDRLMVETDAPYLAPAPYRGKENEPAYVKEVAYACAEHLGVAFEALCEQTTANAQSFFALPNLNLPGG